MDTVDEVDLVDREKEKEDEGLIPKHGGYRKLKSFQIAQLAYDVTVRFCERYIDRRSRTHDQMVQAARSGVQNIAEGSKASGTSKKFELKLTSVARASLEELKLDYEDFLRHRRLAAWDREDPRRKDLIARRCRTVEEVAQWTREVHQSMREGKTLLQPSTQSIPSASSSPSTLSTSSTQSISSSPSSSSPSTYPEIAANGALALIAVACSLLDRQLAAQAATFEQEGGFTERLYQRRTRSRQKY